MNIVKEYSEKNKRYYAKKQYGYGHVLNSQKNLDIIRSLSVKQIKAILEMIFWGDIHEIAPDELLLGKMKLPSPSDVEGEVRTQIAACLVYLSGNLAEDFGDMLTEKEKNGKV